LIPLAQVATIWKNVATRRKVPMLNAGIKDVKNNLSRYLAFVKAGEEVVITERGKPVARIVKESGSVKSIRAALAPLVREGLIALPAVRLKNGGLSVPKDALPGKPVSEIVIEDRR
jgi:antitoxin (DNA-binding transcriptional repressor) of toxin-antitoxin stability system